MVSSIHMGEGGSELKLTQPGRIRLTARVAARLADQPDNGIRTSPTTDKPYWHLERARIGDGREVPVEVVVNGLPVARKTILCDGELRDLSFEIPLERSSWVALRILPSCSSGLQAGCTASTVAVDVFMVPPVFGGVEIRLTSDVVAQISFQPGTALPSPVSVDFVELLEGTPWN